MVNGEIQKVRELETGKTKVSEFKKNLLLLKQKYFISLPIQPFENQ